MTSQFVVSLAKFVHWNFKGFVFMVCHMGKITKLAKSSVSKREERVKACCQTNLIFFFLFSKPCLFIAVTDISRRKTSETKSRCKSRNDSSGLKENPLYQCKMN